MPCAPFWGGGKRRLLGLTSPLALPQPSAWAPRPARSGRSVFAHRSAAAGRAISGPTAVPGARSSSGAQTASRTAAAIPTADAIQPAESAAATRAGGGCSASRPACVGSEATATLSQAPAGVIQAGGPLTVGGSASAISQAPAVIRPPAAASAIGAGGAGDVPLSAAATDRLVPRSLGDANAQQGGGGQPASTCATVCTACAHLRMDAARVMLATEAPAAQSPARGGTYGPQCAHSCGHCRNREPCSPVEGACLACDPGWNGTHCRQPCPLGLYGENCTQPCPRHCRRGETCHPQTGRCRNCEAGFVGASCNQTCLEAFHGPNCSTACPCTGGPCHPFSGDCQQGVQGQGALLAGILGPLLLLFLLGCFCCCCCCHRLCGAASVDRAPGAEQDRFPPAKHRLMAMLPSIPPSLPCFSRGGSKLPRVTVTHRDPEAPFNPSFIEPTSAAWPSDSSFSSSSSSSSEGVNKERGGCQEPQSALPHSEALPEGSLLLEATAVHPSPFAIPRTSSIAKGKRPSVSFAEGTHFGPQSLKAPLEAVNPAWKPTASESPVQGAPPLQTNQPTGASCHSQGRSCYENMALTPWEDSGWASAGNHLSGHGTGEEPPEAAAVEACIQEPSITTIYVTVGQAGRGSKDPPLSVPQHWGSGQEEATWARSLKKLPRKLAAEAGPGMAEAQGLLASDQKVEGVGSSSSLDS